MNAFRWHYFMVKFMKRARAEGGPWSDLEYARAGRSRDLETYINLLRFVFSEDD
jgi:hypothetical protein